MEAGQKDMCSAKPMPQHCHHPRGFCKSDRVEKHLVVRIKVSALDSLSLIPTFYMTSQPFKSCTMLRSLASCVPHSVSSKTSSPLVGKYPNFDTIKTNCSEGLWAAMHVDAMLQRDDVLVVATVGSSE